MEMHQVRYFLATVSELNFTKAADELSLTQSAVSRQIQALEESLGTRLFERRTRALLLTDNGQRYYQVVQELLKDLDDSTQKLRGAAAAPWASPGRTARCSVRCPRSRTVHSAPSGWARSAR